MKRLSSDELELLREYHAGTETPDEGDPFPELSLEIDQTGFPGPLLVYNPMIAVELHMAKGKVPYRNCVLAPNKKRPSRRKDPAWRQRLNVQEDCTINRL